MLPDDINMQAVSDMLSSLSQADIDSLTKLAGSFFSSQDKPSDSKKEEKASSVPFDFDADALMKIASVMSRLGSRPEDPRCRLLQDLKPMLSRERQKKVDTAIQLLQMISLMPLIKELS